MAVEHSRARNRATLLDLINLNGGMTTAELAEKSKLSRATVGEILRDFEREGLINRKTDHEAARDARGRPPSLIVPADVGRFTLCLDVGHFRLRGAVFAPDGELIEDLNPRDSHVLEALAFPAVLKRIHESAKKLLASAGLKPKEIRGIAVSLPAAIHKTGALANRKAFESWPRVPQLVVKDSFRQKFGRLPVLVANDVNLCLLGEQRLGSARGVSDVLFIKATTGYGCALLSRGELHEGFNGIAGQIGHLLTTDQFDHSDVHELCETCGQRGCLKNVASTDAIVANVRRLKMEAGKHSAEDDLVLGIGEVIDLALYSDDFECKKAIERAGRYLGMAIRHLVQWADPELVLVGGVLSRAGDVLLDEIRDEFLVDAKRYPGRERRISRVADYEKSALYGGFVAVQDRLLSSG